MQRLSSLLDRLGCRLYGHVWVHPLDYWTYVTRYEPPVPEISPDYCARCGLLRLV
jgi:hypothetical protein